ncbi:MAG: ArnT family glycosyltransferase [Candidatus Eisenbacteria bacterium]
MRTPGWPVVLAGIHVVSGESRRVVVMWQAIFDAVTALGLGHLALRLFRRREAAAVAFLWVALWPPFMISSRHIFTEPLFMMLVTLMWIAAERALGDRAGNAFPVGLWCGAAAMVRATAPVMIVGVLIGWWWLARPNWSRVWRFALWVALGFTLIVGPWAARNALVFGRFIPLSLQSGELFYQGVMLETDGRWDHDAFERARRGVLEREAARLGHPPDAMESDRAMRREGLEILRSHPAESALIALKRLWRIVFTPVVSSDRAPARLGFFVAILLLYALALPVALRSARAGDATGRFPAILAVTWAVTLLVSAAFYSTSRYAEPFRTIPMLLASGTVGAFLARGSTPRSATERDARHGIQGT